MEKNSSLLEHLAAGYTDFKKNADNSFYQELSKGQHPHTMVICCSDSRVVPEIIFNTKPGELFVLREVGALAGPENIPALAALEFAIKQLKIRNVILLVHHNCGALAALKEKESLEGNLQIWLEKESFCGKNEQEAAYQHGITQYERAKQIPIIREALPLPDFTLTLMIFDIKTHSVAFYNPQKKCWKDFKG